MDDWMTTREVAEEVGMSPRWVESRIADGTLQAYAWDLGQRRIWRVRRADLEAFWAAHLRPAASLPPRSERSDEE